MKSKIFFLTLILALISGGYFLFGADVKILRFGNSIEPYEKWGEILPGKWKFKTVWKKPKKGHIFNCRFEGEVEFYANGKYKRFITISNNLMSGKFEGGGSYSGKWSLDKSGTWVETTTDCNISAASIWQCEDEGAYCCDKFSPSIVYGNQEDLRIRTNVEVFSKDRILIKGKNFAQDLNLSWELVRID